MTPRSIKSSARLLTFFAAFAVVQLTAANRQEAPQPVAPSTEHVLGTVTATDPAAKTITVKDDKSAVEQVISLAQTRSIFRVLPGAKDLKGATRIDATDLSVGDRVDVRGFKDTSGTGIVARSVVLMSAADLAQKREREMEQWQNSVVGTVTAADPAAHTLSVTVRSADGPKPVTVQTTSSTAFTRYSPQTPKTPAASDFASVQAGDQLHIIGQKNDDGSSISADKIYSAAVRTVAATIIEVAPEGKQLTVRNLQNRQPVTILLTDDSAIRKLPPEMAAMLARRFNPGAARAAATSGGPPASGPSSAQRPAWNGGNAPGGSNGANAGAASGQPRRGSDLSRMLDRVPTISVGDLKPGNAVVIWGVAGADPNTIAARTVLAGVEPVLQSAPASQSRSLDANWNLDMSVPAQ